MEGNSSAETGGPGAPRAGAVWVRDVPGGPVCRPREQGGEARPLVQGERHWGRRAGGSPSQGASNSSMPSKNHLGAYKNADSPSQGVGLGNARVWNVHSCLDEYWSVGRPRWFPPGAPCSKQRLSFPGFLERKGQEKGR